MVYPEPVDKFQELMNPEYIQSLKNEARASKELLIQRAMDKYQTDAEFHYAVDVAVNVTIPNTDYEALKEALRAYGITVAAVALHLKGQTSG